MYCLRVTRRTVATANTGKGVNLISPVPQPDRTTCQPLSIQHITLAVKSNFQPCQPCQPIQLC